MAEFFRQIFSTDFMPHVYCLRIPSLIWLHAVSNALVAFAYLLIPLALIHLVRKRRDLAFNWMFVLFAAFILSCGATHLMDVVTLWEPMYRLSVTLAGVTAVMSLPTAVLLLRLVPKAAAIPSAAQWRELSEKLQIEIEERQRAELEVRALNAELEARVAARTRELSQTENALRRANAELEQFAYAAAHDLQEPLRNVALSTQMLAAHLRGNVDAQASQFIELAVDGAQRMHGMIRDLLAYCRVSDHFAAKSSPADLNTVLTVTLKNLRSSIEETDAEVVWSDLPLVCIPEAHLAQIFQNLVSNSIKYRGKNPPVIKIAAERQREEWQFSVKDNGSGIAPEYHERVFKIFKRLKKDVAGSGIGLALCRRIVEMYGGKMWVESELDQGATFLFTVPRDLVQELDPPEARLAAVS